jgi:hypothetical protein
VRSIKETSGSPQELYVVAMKGRLNMKQIQGKVRVYALRLQAKFVGGG